MHYLNEQVKYIKELGDQVTNLCRLGAPEFDMAEDLFEKYTSGDSTESSALGYLPLAMGAVGGEGGTQLP